MTLSLTLKTISNWDDLDVICPLHQKCAKYHSIPFMGNTNLWFFVKIHIFKWRKNAVLCHFDPFNDLRSALNLEEMCTSLRSTKREWSALRHSISSKVISQKPKRMTFPEILKRCFTPIPFRKILAPCERACKK